MVRPMYDYTALHRIPALGPVAYYQRGDDVQAAVVEQLGLVVGEDVVPARADVIPRPADNAKRAEWVDFAVGQGMPRDEADDLTVAELRDRYPEGARRTDFVSLDDRPDPLRPVDPARVTEQGRRLPPESEQSTDPAAVATGVNAVNVPADPSTDDDGEQSARPAASATKAEWVEFAVSQGMAADEANDLTKPELQKRFAE